MGDLVLLPFVILGALLLGLLLCWIRNAIWGPEWED